MKKVWGSHWRPIWYHVAGYVNYFGGVYVAFFVGLGELFSTNFEGQLFFLTLAWVLHPHKCPLFLHPQGAILDPLSSQHPWFLFGIQIGKHPWSLSCLVSSSLMSFIIPNGRFRNATNETPNAIFAVSFPIIVDGLIRCISCWILWILFRRAILRFFITGVFGGILPWKKHTREVLTAVHLNFLPSQIESYCSKPLFCRGELFQTWRRSNPCRSPNFEAASLRKILFVV